MDDKQLITTLYSLHTHHNSITKYYLEVDMNFYLLGLELIEISTFFLHNDARKTHLPEIITIS